MKYIETFENFLFELNLSSHWLARTSLKNDVENVNKDKSRMGFYDNGFKSEGWLCYNLVKCSIEGEAISPKKTVEYHTFIDNLEISEQEFANYIKLANHNLCENSLIKKYDKTNPFRRSIYLGRVIFQIKTNNEYEYWYPQMYFFNKGQMEKKQLGNSWWASAAMDTGLTVIPRDKEDSNFDKKLLSDEFRSFQNKVREGKDERYQEYNWIKTEKDFASIYEIVYPFGKNFVIVIPNNKDYNKKEIIESIEKQSSGLGFIEKGEQYIPNENYELPPGPQQFNLAEGRRLTIKRNVGDIVEWKEMEIVRIVNRNSFKDDKFFSILARSVDGKMSFLNKTNNEVEEKTLEAPTMIKIKADDVIKMKSNEKYANAKVLNPFYLLDTRQKEPLNLRFKFL